MDYKFSVLMSIYIKEKAEYFQDCMESIMAQTLMPDEIVIVKDGPITEELEQVLDYYIKSNPGLIKTVRLEKNRGLGLALAEGIINCSHELVARMDTDDICVKNRFEKQIDEIKKNPHIDIIGSYIKEFDGVKENVIAERKVPLENKEIRQYQRKRSAFNHVTVLFKKSAVLKAGNYKNALFVEDDLLWCDMLKCGCYGKNVPETLVYVRSGTEMIKRRGGIKYFLRYCTGRKKILETGFISRWDFISTCVVQFFVCMVPESFRGFIFRKLLRT